MAIFPHLSAMFTMSLCGLSPHCGYRTKLKTVLVPPYPGAVRLCAWLQMTIELPIYRAYEQDVSLGLTDISE